MEEIQATAIPPSGAFGEAHTVIEGVAFQLRTAPDTITLDELWQWARIVSGWLCTIGVEEINAEHNYKQVRQRIRDQFRSVADTDLQAEASDEFKYWREWRQLHEDGELILKTIMRFLVVLQEQQRISRL